ncbi:carboxypeptidase-like regulatory domain-containing protein [Paludibaculum fermentans]|uniref:carboxypeptidase-like regulatory domain-containing protein n=1 Tax=Paludibaculum fermentans TaxID=1473598 RepID=UPI003EB864CB
MQSYHAMTDARGLACLAMPEGLYAIEAGLTGFLNVRYSPVRVEAGRKTELVFTLPLGDVRGDSVVLESILSGTLRNPEGILKDALICAYTEKGSSRVGCTSTDGMGEYAMAVPTGKYRIEIKTVTGALSSSTIDLSMEWAYRNLLSWGGKLEPAPKK